MKSRQFKEPVEQHLVQELTAFDAGDPPSSLVPDIMAAAGAVEVERPWSGWMVWPAAVAASVAAIALGLLAGQATVPSPSAPTIDRPAISQAAPESMLDAPFALLPGGDETLELLAFNASGESR